MISPSFVGLQKVGPFSILPIVVFEQPLLFHLVATFQRGPVKQVGRLRQETHPRQRCVAGAYSAR